MHLKEMAHQCKRERYSSSADFLKHVTTLAPEHFERIEKRMQAFPFLGQRLQQGLRPFLHRQEIRAQHLHLQRRARPAQPQPRGVDREGPRAGQRRHRPKAAEALDTVAAWIGDISPEGVLAYKEEESRGVWQTGKAAFMRNWPYAWALGQGDDSAVKDKFAIAPLPSGGDGSAATLGGWNLAVSKYSENQEAAIELVMFLSGEEAQKTRAIELTRLPTLKALYDDPEVADAQPSIPQWKEIFLNTVPRPSAPTTTNYNEVSKEFWDAVHATLSGERPAEASLKRLEARLTRLKGSGW